MYKGQYPISHEPICDVYQKASKVGFEDKKLIQIQVAKLLIFHVKELLSLVSSDFWMTVSVPVSAWMDHMELI